MVQNDHPVSEALVESLKLSTRMDSLDAGLHAHVEHKIVEVRAEAMQVSAAGYPA
jgi:hypothetical protein